jgi:hypothetical protein
MSKKDSKKDEESESKMNRTKILNYIIVTLKNLKKNKAAVPIHLRI